MKKPDPSQNPFVIAAKKAAKWLRNAPPPADPADNPNLKKALELVAQGKRVIPIDADGKPVTYNGDERDATSDPQMVNLMWLVWPAAEVGVVDEEPK